MDNPPHYHQYWEMALTDRWLKKPTPTHPPMQRVGIIQDVYIVAGFVQAAHYTMTDHSPTLAKAFQFIYNACFPSEPDQKRIVPSFASQDYINHTKLYGRADLEIQRHYFFMLRGDNNVIARAAPMEFYLLFETALELLVIYLATEVTGELELTPYYDEIRCNGTERDREKGIRKYAVLAWDHLKGKKVQDDELWKAKMLKAPVIKDEQFSIADSSTAPELGNLLVVTNSNLGVRQGAEYIPRWVSWTDGRTIKTGCYYYLSIANITEGRRGSARLYVQHEKLEEFKTACLSHRDGKGRYQFYVTQAFQYGEMKADGWQRFLVFHDKARPTTMKAFFPTYMVDDYNKASKNMNVKLKEFTWKESSTHEGKGTNALPTGPKVLGSGHQTAADHVKVKDPKPSPFKGGVTTTVTATIYPESCSASECPPATGSPNALTVLSQAIESSLPDNTNALSVLISAQATFPGRTTFTVTATAPPPSQYPSNPSASPASNPSPSSASNPPSSSRPESLPSESTVPTYPVSSTSPATYPTPYAPTSASSEAPPAAPSSETDTTTTVQSTIATTATTTVPAGETSAVPTPETSTSVVPPGPTEGSSVSSNEVGPTNASSSTLNTVTSGSATEVPSATTTEAPPAGETTGDATTPTSSEIPQQTTNAAYLNQPSLMGLGAIMGALIFV